MTYWKALWLNFAFTGVLVILAITALIHFGVIAGVLSGIAAIFLRGEIMWRIRCKECGTSLWGRSHWMIYFTFYYPDRVCSGCGRHLGAKSNEQSRR
jgi:hypothetical protein